MKKVKSSQASISIKHCTELNKAQFFPASIVYEVTFREILKKRLRHKCFPLTYANF